MGKSKGRKVTLKERWMGFEPGIEVPYLLRPEIAKALVDRGVAFYSNAKTGGKSRAKHRMAEAPSNE